VRDLVQDRFGTEHPEERSVESPRHVEHHLGRYVRLDAPDVIVQEVLGAAPGKAQPLAGGEKLLRDLDGVVQVFAGALD
jgi:hypothetical protein